MSSTSTVNSLASQFNKLDLGDSKNSNSDSKTSAKVSSLQNCGFCEKPDAKNLCKKCSLIRYCNDECQKSASKIHDKVCHPPLIGTYVEFAVPPSDPSFLAKVNEKTPYLFSKIKKYDSELVSKFGSVPIYEFEPKKMSFLKFSQMAPRYVEDLMSRGLFNLVHMGIKLESGEWQRDHAAKSLKPWAEKGYAEPMICYAYYLGKNGLSDKKTLEEIWKWQTLGSYCRLLDWSCLKESFKGKDAYHGPTTSSRIPLHSHSEATYRFGHGITLTPEQVEKSSSVNTSQFQQETITNWEDLCPRGSLFALEFSIPDGVSRLKPEDEWKESRQRQCQAVLKRFEAKLKK